MIGIEIAMPVFRCKSEQDVFFERLSDVAGIIEVKRFATVVRISISSAQQITAIAQIKAICEMWLTSYRDVSD